MNQNEGDALVDSFNAKLESLSSLSNQSCIYKVPNKLRRLNPDAYSPRLVSFGPFHRGKEELQAMEEHKYRYLHSFLPRTIFSLQDLVRVARTWEENTRNCYAEYVRLNVDEFVEMLVLDASFLVELLLSFADGVLKIPTIIIDDLTEYLYRDIIVFEHCHCSNKNFLHYTRLLSCFIKSPADADLLIRNGILVNDLGNAKDVSKLFNSICKEVIYDLGNAKDVSKLFNSICKEVIYDLGNAKDVSKLFNSICKEVIFGRRFYFLRLCLSIYLIIYYRQYEEICAPRLEEFCFMMINGTWDWIMETDQPSIC
ncbi:unnamed protein product [Microthlaspi erraticum]|uniref:Uncharacterized protein n=1 Tax=Microthlaspi erraticum TaxID=1685480 RepID=A0A6D2IDV2_9BRAS|nr:unnamed protein product [Microthlaspi erraticum]